MTPSHCSGPASTRTDPFRWPRADAADAQDHFLHPDHSSQRQYAQEHGIPRSTLGYWLRRDDPTDLDNNLVAFFRSPSGEAFLRRIVLAALTTFQLQGACGIRLVSTFLQRTQLDRFVASSRGALHPLSVHLESDLAAFRDEEQPPLAQQMKPRTITLVPDEHFHSVKNCLVAIEPVSNFIAVECYRDRRDADTWTEVITEGTRGMPVEIVQLTSDLARGLLCCAEKGLQAAHSPDLFHGQRDLLKPLLLPLNQPIQQAQKDLEKAQRLSNKLDGPVDEPQPWQEFVALVEAVKNEQAIGEQLEQAKERQEEAVQQVRGVGDDYHPFDRETGKPVTAEEVGERLNGHLDKLQEVVQEAGLGEKAKEAVNKGRTWVQTLMGCVAWFWCLVNARVEGLGLTEEQEQQVKEKVLAGHYWERAAGRARTAVERKRLKEMAENLKGESWQEGGALSSLPEEVRKEVEEVARESAGLFQRSSSCVEGRNGRLSLQHHGHSRVSEPRLQALTVIHNYMVKRADGSTAAERFFGLKHKDLFSWLLQRMPDLPRPAQKRPATATQAVPVAE
jgi:uncharacterized protein DUF6399